MLQFNLKGQIVYDPQAHGNVSLLLLGTSFSPDDELFFTESNRVTCTTCPCVSVVSFLGGCTVRYELRLSQPDFTLACHVTLKIPYLPIFSSPCSVFRTVLVLVHNCLPQIMMLPTSVHFPAIPYCHVCKLHFISASKCIAPPKCNKYTAHQQYCDNTKIGEQTDADGTVHGYSLRDISVDKTRAFVDLRLYLQENIDRLLYVCLNEEHQSGGTYDKIEFVTLEVKFAVPKFEFSLAAKVVLIVILLLLSGLFSGLNLGLMALNVRELEIYSTSGTETQIGYSKAILPLRRRGNLLLCTVLIGNVLVNSVATTLLGTISDGLVAVLTSTAGIVIFGEIVPQSVCSRHGLMIGAKTTFITWFFLIVTFPIAFPISKLLDWVLGREVGTVYQKEQLVELIRAEASAQLDEDERDIVTGALTYADKTVEMVMTPIADVFSLHMDEVLDFETIRRVIDSGHSRIPVIVQHGMRFEIKAVLFVKDMAFVDPEDRIPIESMIKYYQHEVLEVWSELNLDDMLNEFKTKRTHMAAVLRLNKGLDESATDQYDASDGELVGIVTLEDVIEEIIGAEIHDETDRITDNQTKMPLRPVYSTASRNDSVEFQEDSFGPSGEGSEETVAAQTTIGAQPSPVGAALLAYTFLSDKVEAFKEPNITARVLNQLVSNNNMIKTMGHGATEAQRTLYRTGLETKMFTLLIEGKVKITVGREGLQMESGAWSPFCEEALTSDTAYKPDFTVVVDADTPATVFQINRAQYKEAVRGANVERHSSGIARGEIVRVPSGTGAASSVTTPRLNRRGTSALVIEQQGSSLSKLGRVGAAHASQTSSPIKPQASDGTSMRASPTGSTTSLSRTRTTSESSDSRGRSSSFGKSSHTQKGDTNLNQRVFSPNSKAGGASESSAV